MLEFQLVIKKTDTPNLRTVEKKPAPYLLKKWVSSPGQLSNFVPLTDEDIKEATAAYNFLLENHEKTIIKPDEKKE